IRGSKNSFRLIEHSQIVCSPEKLSSSELGIEPIGDAWIQFQIHYYMFALIFVVFDVETVFLYPWAASFDILGVYIVTGTGSVYAWQKGALEWS
ncbi:NAD(P)H-quinone oxidoreductase subunit 3, partial [Nymphaea thermarum]